MSDLFLAPDPLTWRALAQKALKDRPVEGLVRLDADGLDVRPLYAAATGGQPVYAPRPSDAEGRAWDVRTLVEGDDPAAVNTAVLADLSGGAASVILSGAVLADSAPLGRALEGVLLELAPVGLDAGLDGPDAANALAVAAKGSPRARLMFHMDPISAFAEAGVSPRAMDEHLSLAANTAARHAGAYPAASLFMASGRVVREAGGTAVQELAFATANAVALIEAAQAVGMTVRAALNGIVIGLSVDQAHFDGLAKLRAMRLIWRTLTRAYGVETSAAIEVRSSRRMLAARDPWTNLLRLTGAGVAGALGGADAVVLDGFTRAKGLPDAFARRQARNTQIVLMEEAHLGRVDDPAAGSWYLDHRTQALAQAAWAGFQAIQCEGGLVAALKGDLIQPPIMRARAALERAVADGSMPLLGVTQFVDPAPADTTVEAARVVHHQGGGDACSPLTPYRLAAQAEAEIVQ